MNEVQGYKPSQQDEEMMKQSNDLLAYASRTQIVDQKSYDGAVSWLKELKVKAESIEARRVALVKPLNDHVKSINAWLKRPLDIIAEAERKVKATIIAWNNKQEELRMAEQRKIQLVKEAEEKKRQAELAKLAAKAEKKGLTETAQSIRFAAAEPLIVPEAPKTFQEQKGVQTKANWKWELVDINLVPTEWLCVEEKKMNAFAKGTQGGNKIPGIRFYNEPVLAIRLGE